VRARLLRPENRSAHITSMPDLTRLEVMSCSGQVLQKYESAPIAIPKNQVRSVTFPATFVPGKAYLRVTADATLKVLERNETNNVYDGSGSCIH
jgi:subtilase family serine protease